MGRTSPSGKVYPDKPIVNGSEDDLVPVRSIVTKRTGDLSTITPDLIGKKFSFTDGAAIGLSFATSLTEGTTQSALGLKHGGHRLYLWRIISIIAGNICNKINQQGKIKSLQRL